MDQKKIKEYFDRLKTELNLEKLKSRFSPAELKAMLEKIKKIDIKKINRQAITEQIKKINRAKIKKNLIWIVLGIFIVTMVMAKTVGKVKEMIHPKKAKEVVEFAETMPVKVYKVKLMDFKDTLPVMGRIEGFKEIDLIFDGKGILESFNFEEGERILEGDIIANLDQKDALLKLKYASLELEKAKKLFELGGIEKLGLDQKKLEYESAKRDLEKTNIYAPSDGYLGSREKDPGAFVSTPEKVGIFVDLSQVYAAFDVIEEDSTKVKVGQTAEVFLDAYPGASYPGTIDMVSPMIEGRTRTQNVKVELENKENEMKPGMFARAVINTYEKKDALIIPASAFKKQEEKYFVFVVHPDEEKTEEETGEPGSGEKDSKDVKETKEPMAPEEELTDEEMLAEDTKAAEAAKIKPKDKAKEKAKDKKPGKDKGKSFGPPGEEPVVEEEETQTGVVEQREIEVEYLTHDVAEISKGLEEGELIIRELHQEYKSDDKVEITEVQETIF